LENAGGARDLNLLLWFANCTRICVTSARGYGKEGVGDANRDGIGVDRVVVEGARHMVIHVFS
jgi:hypothetical protein